MKAVAVLMLAVAGCGIPAFTSAMRSNFGPDARLEGLCEHTGRDSIESMVEAHYKEGWRLAFVSEYTSSMQTGLPTVICFERPIAHEAPAPHERAD
jgi:hypothetical protein